MSREMMVELSETLRFATQLSFRMAPPSDCAEAWPWYQEIKGPDGSIQAQLAAADGAFVVRYVGLADFRVEFPRVVICHPRHNVPLETIRHLAIDRLLPMLVGHMGKIVVHCAAVAAPTGALVFVAPTQHGKSTLAMSLCHEDACPSLADDCLVVARNSAGVWTGRRIYAGARLWPETIAATAVEMSRVSDVAHYTSKKRVELARSAASAPLRALFFLEWGAPDDAVSILPMPPARAMHDLLGSLFGLYLDDPRKHAENVRGLHDLISSVSSNRLVIPRNIARLPEVRAAVLREALEKEARSQ